MSRKVHVIKRKKIYVKSGSKKTWYYFRISLISLFMGFAVYTGGRYFFPLSAPCANSLTCQSDLTEKIENGATGMFQGQKVIPPIISLAIDESGQKVLGQNVPIGEKHIYVDLATQTLYAYQDDTKILQTYISSGRWGKTPVGNFHIWSKLRATRMSGGSGNDAYNLPNVPYVMFFYRDYGLHGAYWHNNFGHTMSHGCINLRQVDARDLFNWADGPSSGQKGTPVSICNNFEEPNICIQVQPIN